MYKRLVVSQDEHRPYDVIIFFNLPTDVQEAKCGDHCIIGEKNFKKVVYSYQDDAKVPSADFPHPKVFFVIHYVTMDNKGMADIFMNIHKYDTIPWIVVSQGDQNDKWQPGEPFVPRTHQWVLLQS